MFYKFYEDEESLKMMEIINKQADEERVRLNKQAKKEKRNDKLVKIFVVGSLLFITGCIIYLSNLKFEKDVDRCVSQGYSKDVCVYELSK